MPSEICTFMHNPISGTCMSLRFVKILKASPLSKLSIDIRGKRSDIFREHVSCNTIVPPAG